MVPIVGYGAQYIRAGGANPLAALICYVHNPGEVTVAVWGDTGIMQVRQNCPYVVPGDTPPKADYVVPLPVPGAPVVGGGP